jgi:N-acetylated-alpha-linked acidic dipeptidase
VESPFLPLIDTYTNKITSVLGSWDAEEFGLQGSTEWVESHLSWLTSSAVAYLNMDVGVSGPRTSFSGSGEIQTFVVNQMKKVLFPEGWGDFPTLYDMWHNTTQGEISPLGSGSDYASFYQNGIGCIDIGSDGGKKDPIYHYHSNYDSYHWMSTYADPEFKVHAAMGQVFSLILYHLADDKLIPWDLPNAATVLQAYYAELNKTMSESRFPDLDISPIGAAINEFTTYAKRIADVAQNAVAFNDTVILQVVNSKYRDFARGFASSGGLPGRETFKNVISAPGIDNGYGADVFPAVTDSVNAGNEEAALQWVEKTSEAILRAAEILKVGS